MDKSYYLSLGHSDLVQVCVNKDKGLADLQAAIPRLVDERWQAWIDGLNPIQRLIFKLFFNR